MAVTTGPNRSEHSRSSASLPTSATAAKIPFHQNGIRVPIPCRVAVCFHDGLNRFRRIPWREVKSSADYIALFHITHALITCEITASKGQSLGVFRKPDDATPGAITAWCASWTGKRWSVCDVVPLVCDKNCCATTIRPAAARQPRQKVRGAGGTRQQPSLSLAALKLSAASGEAARNRRADARVLIVEASGDRRMDTEPMRPRHHRLLSGTGNGAIAACPPPARARGAAADTRRSISQTGRSPGLAGVVNAVVPQAV